MPCDKLIVCSDSDGYIREVDARIAVWISVERMEVNPPADMNGDSRVTSFNAI